jgi:hypothetical protein
LLQRFFIFFERRRSKDFSDDPAPTSVAFVLDVNLAWGGICGFRAGSRCLVVHFFEELRGGYAQGFGNPDDAQDAGISNAAFDAADVSWIKTGSFCQRLLCEPLFFSPPANVPSEYVQTMTSVSHVVLVQPAAGE